MKVRQYRLQTETDWQPTLPDAADEAVRLLLVFGETSFFSNPDAWLTELQSRFPGAHCLGCSTAGEILKTEVNDHSLAVSAIEFTNTDIQVAKVDLVEGMSSEEAGKVLAQRLEHSGLAHVLVLSNGLKVNGSDLVRGLVGNLPEGTTVSGGLAGDGGRFQQTYVLADDDCSDRSVAVVGFYGNSIQAASASFGGWDSFGPERLVTRSEGNVLYELDHKSALDLYKSYLGDHADGLPATGLLFPLSLRSEQLEHRVVRTILGVDEAEQSITFAGDIPEGSYAQLMKANFDRLIDGANTAAKKAADADKLAKAELAVLISCVGRKMVLKQRVEEEVEAVQDVLGAEAKLTGFYSYGEISPFSPAGLCALHNQTMTITVFSEEG
jgi:hypothetical protein